jgi:hypothetical protein
MRQTALARSTRKAVSIAFTMPGAPSEIMSSGSFSPRVFILDRPIAARSAQGAFRVQPRLFGLFAGAGDVVDDFVVFGGRNRL